MEFERINPLTQEPASKAVAMSPAEACAVADRAANAFPGWSTLGPNARRALLMNAAAALEARKDDFVARDDDRSRRDRRMGHVQFDAGGRHGS